MARIIVKLAPFSKAFHDKCEKKWPALKWRRPVHLPGFSASAASFYRQRASSIMATMASKLSSREAANSASCTSASIIGRR